MMKGKQEKLNKILSLLNVNVFELMDLTLETFGHHLIHEDAVKNCRENIDDLALEQKKELYSKLSPLFSTLLTADNYIEFREVFRFASVLHCALPYDHQRTEEHSDYFHKLSSFDYGQIDQDSMEDDRYKIRGYERYNITSRDAFDSVYSNSILWHKIKGHGSISDSLSHVGKPLAIDHQLPVCDYLTKKSLEDYFKSEFIKIENDLIKGDYHPNMQEQLDDIFISEAFDTDFLIDSFIELFLSDFPSKNHMHSYFGLSSYYDNGWGDDLHPMLRLFEAEPFIKKLRDRLSRGLVLGCRNTKRFIKENISQLHDLSVFASVLSQFQDIASNDLDRELNHMTKQSDIYEHLNNFDAALTIASESFRLERLANETPKEAMRQRKKFIRELVRKFGDPEENWPDYRLQNRLYNYCVLQKNLDHVYADKRFPIPEYSSDSREPYELFISDKEVEFNDDEVSWDFTEIFEFIQRFINEKNKDNYEVWH